MSAEDYLAELDPDIVVEIHLAGGEWLKDFHTDSHSRPTPSAVWQWASDWAPRLRNLAAITYEYHESHHKRLGLDGVARELDLMHALADDIAEARTTEAA